MQFIIELVLEAIGDVLLLVVRLTWPGVVCGVAAGWTLLVVWLAATAVWAWLVLRQRKPPTAN